MKPKSIEKTYMKHCYTKGLFIHTHWKGLCNYLCYLSTTFAFDRQIEYSDQAPQLTTTLKLCFQFII